MANAGKDTNGSQVIYVDFSRARVFYARISNLDPTPLPRKRNAHY